MKNWLYPANPKYYDILSAFTQEDETAWPMNTRVEIGDQVYIYSAQPHSQILFRCQVVGTGLPAEATMAQAEKYLRVQGGGAPNKSFMLLKTVQQYVIDPSSPASFSMLKQHGLKGSIMGPLCLDKNPELFGYISGLN